MGMEVVEKSLTIESLLEWATHGEVALSGTAAILAPVGTLVVDGEDVQVGSGDVGETTLALRQALIDIQIARVPDSHGWTTPVG